MNKPLLIALLAAAGAMLCTDDAYARCRRGYGQRSGTWFYNSAPANVQSATVTQSNPGSTYQSYSYEPGQTNAGQPAAVAPVYQTPIVYQQRANSNEYNNVIRGDRKVRGHTAEGE